MRKVRDCNFSESPIWRYIYCCPFQSRGPRLDFVVCYATFYSLQIDKKIRQKKLYSLPKVAIIVKFEIKNPKKEDPVHVLRPIIYQNFHVTRIRTQSVVEQHTLLNRK